MPFDGHERVHVRSGRRHAKQQMSPVEWLDRAQKVESLYLRNIVGDNIRQLPYNEPTIVGHTSQPVTMNSHIRHASIPEYGRQLKQSAVSVGSRDDTHTTTAHSICDPMSSSNRCTRQEDGVLLDQRDSGRLDEIARSLNLLHWLSNIENNCLRLHTGRM